MRQRAAVDATASTADASTANAASAAAVSATAVAARFPPWCALFAWLPSDAS